MAAKNENLPINADIDLHNGGTIKYANEVIAIIAGVAAGEVDGIAGMCTSGGFGDIISRNRNITRGVKVELGSEEARYNREFGENMADSVDEAILVGPKHTAPIREGLLSRGFPEEHIHTVNCLNEAAALMRQLAKPGDTVLFENDLPDNYSET